MELFDEYDYLEKAVENSEPRQLKETSNGRDDTENSREKDRRRSSRHRSDENNDTRHDSKLSKSGDKSRDHDRHRDKGSSRHRSRSRDGKRDRHRSSRESRDKDRDRNREEGTEKDKGRDRDRERDRDQHGRGRERETEREMEKEKERSRRSRSTSERRRSDQDETEKERNREQEEYRKKEKEIEFRDHDRFSRRHKDKKEDGTEAEADPERDQRTVFAYQITLKADERDVYEFFSKAGKVRDVRLIMDRNSRRSKGVGYIEFYDAMSVPMAIALSGHPLLGQPVMVKPSEAEKNLVQSTASAAGLSGGLIGPYSGGARRLYVGNLHSEITEDQLQQVFAPFGAVELVQVPLDESGHCKGFGFVQFARLEDARAAQSLNGQLEIGGRAIKVSTITDQVGVQELGANTGDFDDDEGGGMGLNARSRAILMQKLDRSGATSSAGLALPVPLIPGAASAASPLVAPLIQSSVTGLTGFPGASLQPQSTVPSVDSIGVPSQCLLLTNMFDPTVEMEPDFELDIKEDVQEECSKFGHLKHIDVDKNSAGFVYLRFENAEAAISAQSSLHGRWFAGKMITATFMMPQTYEAQFPESR